MAYSPLAQRALVFVDTETTGLDPAQHEIIELAFIREDPGSEPVRFEAKIKPQHIERAQPRALEINGYTEEAWAGSKPFSEHATFIAEHLSNCLLVGHNISFDVDFIQNALDRCGVEHKISYHKLDTVTLAYEHLVPVGLDSLSLVNVSKFLGWETMGAHSAMFDAERCREVFHLLSRSSRVEWEEWVKLGRPTMALAQ